MAVLVAVVVLDVVVVVVVVLSQVGPGCTPIHLIPEWYVEYPSHNSAIFLPVVNSVFENAVPLRSDSRKA